VRARNDPAQYDDLADAWWDPRGEFVMLHWLAAARARHIPDATRPDSLLLDLACGGGLLAPHVAGKGHRHVGLDLSVTALPQARTTGSCRCAGTSCGCRSRTRSPTSWSRGGARARARAARAGVGGVPRPAAGRRPVLDTIAATRWGRFLSITVGERVPAGPPSRLHDPELFVDRRALVAGARRCGVELQLTGLRVSALDYLAWLAGRRDGVRMLPTRSTAALFQASGRKT
jgi:2-polyprenyl-6-hydroxyphenyl methylase/3-demethylubiquinone-9 3-methyltransferase